MKLALHQLRLEFLRSRVGFILYLLMLACNFVVAAGWIDRITVREDGYWDRQEVFPVILVVTYWIAFAIMVSACVIADSPARRERFLASRPMPGPALAGGKVLYLLLAAIAPAVLLECLTVAYFDYPASAVVTAGLERALFLTVIGLAVAAFAAHWKSVPGFFLACVIGFISVTILGGFTFELLEGVLREQFRITPHPPTFLTWMQAVLAGTAGLALTAWVVSKRGQKLRFLIPALVPVLLLGATTIMITPYRSIPLAPRAQETIDRYFTSGGASIEIAHRGLHASRMGSTQQLSASYSVKPLVNAVPNDLEIRWTSMPHRWELDGKVVQQQPRPFEDLGSYFVPVDEVPVSWSLSETIQQHLGTQVLFQVGSQGTSMSAQLSTTSFPYDPAGLGTKKSVQLRGEVIGDVFDWQIAADLPFEKGGRDEEFDWEIAETRFNGSNLEVMFKEKALSLHLTRDPALRSAHRHWRTRYQIALYLPKENAVWFGTLSHSRPAISVSAAKRYFGEIDIHQSQRRWKSQRDRFDLEQLEARLLILEPEYLGRIRQNWESPKIALRSEPTNRHGESNSSVEGLSQAEFAYWFHKLPKLSPGDDPAAVHPHLDEIIDRYSRTEQFRRPRQPAILYLAEFVPDHLPYLIKRFNHFERFPQFANYASEMVLEAITIGATPDQKELVADAITNNPQFARVAARRGWDEEAKEHYLALAQNSSAGDGPLYLAKLLSFDDPTLDQASLRAFRAQPDLRTYQALRSHPRLAQEAEKVASQLWNPGRLVLFDNNIRGNLAFGLVQGRPEALEELFAVARFHEGEKDGTQWPLAQLMRSGVHIPERVTDGNQDPTKVIKWLLKYKPDDFRYDPVFRRFVLKAAHDTA